MTNTDRPRHPLTPAYGYVRVAADSPDGFAVRGYSSSVERARQSAGPDDVVVDIRRAREIAERIHGWDLTGAEGADQ